ncbi:DNA topoisomerase 1-like [Zingiber officinale]|uniref:DNA topoisomerase 1-like n=1 Tax=Zingiber officinale TaxID=94328 RepID=UPI001C4B232D|nr:DNA topoisomerase 1-like [Zingiber officinale]XP_042399091.1 DNA topoisomerase 1-like [Zingiber officinale]XP_042399092.1 DNA topoisomerase 1-like [Zingiber officinale]
MALQMRRLFLTSSLPNHSRLTSTMLQYKLGQNFPPICLQNSVFFNSINYGMHAHRTRVRLMYSSISKYKEAATTFKLLHSNKESSIFSRIGNSLSCQTRQADNCSRFRYFSGELLINRLFSSNIKRKIQNKTRSNSVGKTQVSGIESKGNQDPSAKVSRGARKQKKTTATSDNVDGKTHATVSKSSKKAPVITTKITSKTSNVGESKKESVKVVKKKTKQANTKTPVKDSKVVKKKTKQASTKTPVKDSKVVKKKTKQASTKTPVKDSKVVKKKTKQAVTKTPVKDSKAPETKKQDSSKKKPGQSTIMSVNGLNAAGRVLSTVGGSHETNSTYQKSSNKAKRQKIFTPLYPPSGKSVVVVESATKAKVIQKYLGESYEVLPSYGHVRDLAARSRSVRPDDDFSMVWEVPAAAWTHLKSIKVALNGAENLILASDPDREGEAIAWHINEMLQQQDALNEDITVARVVFHEITESAIKKSLQTPREIDMNLVNAYLARRALDYLIGFNISPLLWRKLPGCQSAGRVQSAALALICDRETEIDQFNKQEYWTIDGEFQDAESDSANRNTSFLAHLTHLKSKKLDKLSIGSHEEAEGIEKQVSLSKFKVKNIKTGKAQRNPPMPYITSTLQQDAANKLNFPAAYTMKLAQKLYEGIKLSDDEATGLITYMRTDGLNVSNEAAEDILSLVKERYGIEYASKSIRKYFRKVKNAQEAHEAIRPTSIRRLPSSLVGILDDDSLKLYTLIWSQSMACQMEAASIETIQVDIANTEGGMLLRSTASQVAFLGYQAVYEDKEVQLPEKYEKEEDANVAAFHALHKLKVDDFLNLHKVHSHQHHTKPPPRYSEGSLVKKLEELGIGRPSTYASTMKVLKDRNYISMQNRALLPEFRGRMVSAFLSHHFSEVADYSFTADMENELDNVSTGTTEWKGLLKDYWLRFSKYCDQASNCNFLELENMLEKKFDNLLFASLSSRKCPSCSVGTLKFKISKFGAGFFIGCDQHPKCKYIASSLYSNDDDDDIDEAEKIDVSFIPKVLGCSPGSTEKIYLKKGPYGFYVQLGEDRKGFSPRRASLSEMTKDFASFTLEDAIELFQYPKTLGKHPTDEYPVVLAHSKHGFLIKHRKTVVTLPKSFTPKTITLEASLKLLSSKKAKMSGRRKGSSTKKSNGDGSW